MPNDTKSYSISEAIESVKTTAKEKFDASVEVHINLNLEKKQSIRFTTTLPHGTGQTVKVAVISQTKIPSADLSLTEDDIKKIQNGDIKPKDDFDILIAHPSIMPKVASVAPILGPAGVMPNPKNGTITEDIEKAIEEIKKGKTEIRTEQNAPIIHTIIGKVSYSVEQLVENFNELIRVLNQNKPPKVKPDWIGKIFVCSSMGKSYTVELS